MLRGVYVAGEHFSRISSGAFNVDTIKGIFIWATNISVIEDNAFYSQKKSFWTFDFWTNWSQNDFSLYLKYNPLLSGDSFAQKAFSNINKPTKLYLGYFASNDDFSWKSAYLPEKTFLPFLQISDKNQVLFQESDDFPLDCNDCRNAWLKNNPNELKKVLTKKDNKDESYSQLRCANNKKFDEEDNFNNCTIRY